MSEQTPKLSDQDLAKLRELLVDQYQWPTTYMFKFVVPNDQVNEVEKLFPNHKAELKESRKGNYVSLTVSIQLESADHVIAIYQLASRIPGLIAI